MAHSMTESEVHHLSGGASDDYDLVFVGAGASTSYTLSGLFAALLDHAPASPLRIAVIERDIEPFSGVAYGRRTSRSSLLITALRDFLPDGERARFADWLSVNKERVFGNFLATAGPLGARWWARHRAEIQRDDFDGLFLPRFVFGAYLEERARSAIADAGAAGAARTHLRIDEVLSIDPDANGYVLTCGTGSVTARRVVLAVGSPPTLSRLEAKRNAPARLLVDTPFDDLTWCLQRVREALQDAGTRSPHVVIIGSNASAMDLLYQINDLDVPEVRATVFSLLSPRGRLPERMVEPESGLFFEAEELRALEEAETVSAASVYEAAVGDILRGEADGLSGSHTYRPIWNAVDRLLKRLSAEEVAAFAGHWGTELGRFQRRAGAEYCEVVDDLRVDGRLRLVAGAFVDITGGEGEAGRIRFERDGVLYELEPAVDIVINCGGFVQDIRESAPSLLAGLVTSGLCRPTPFGRGISVDASFSAAPGLYVMGPLLAGNVVNGTPIWHMEHCGRITSFGSGLGADLARSLVTDTVPGSLGTSVV